MSDMVRKQFYIHKRHQVLLRRLSQARGVSEAEIVRQAIERETTGATLIPTPPDRAAWAEIVRFLDARKALTPGSEGSEPYQWNREDAYQERERRFQTSYTE